MANYCAIPIMSDVSLAQFWIYVHFSNNICMRVPRKNPALIQRLAREIRLAARVVELKRMAGVGASKECSALCGTLKRVRACLNLSACLRRSRDMQ